MKVQQAWMKSVTPSASMTMSVRGILFLALKCGNVVGFGAKRFKVGLSPLGGPMAAPGLP
jgi:hypothetical protein